MAQLTGFQSAIVRSQPGIPLVGTYTLLMLTVLIGSTSSPPAPRSPRGGKPSRGRSRATRYFLAVLADNDQPTDTKMELFAMLNSSICMFAQWEANQRQAGCSEQWQNELVTYLGQAAASGEYPHLAATFAAGAGRVPDLDFDVFFTRAIGRVISIVLAA